MSNNDAHESSLDRAIDGAIREMVQMDPRPGLRQRVLHRLEDAPQRRGWTGIGALATAALLMLVVAITSERGSELQPASPGQAAAQPSATPGALPLGPPPAGERPEAAAARPAETARRTEPTPESIFGPRNDKVRGASISSTEPVEPLRPVPPLDASGSQETKPVSVKEPAAARPPAQLANLKVEVTITDEREGVGAIPKTVSVVTADRQWGRIRSRGADTVLNVDAQPEMLPDGRIRFAMTLEYRPLPVPAEKHPLSVVSKTITAILENGKTLNVSRSSDPGSNRTVKVDVRASVLK